MGYRKRQGKVLQVTVLSAALMGIYGVVSAQPDNDTLICRDSCEQPAPGTSFYGESTTDNDYEWVVKAESATLNLTGGTVKGIGSKMRGVGSTAGSVVTLDGVTVITDTTGGSNWGSHGVQAQEADSVLIMDGGSISTRGEYSNGIQAGAGGQVTGTDVTITTDGQGSHTFGVEANNGGRVELTGGSIEVMNGHGAAGVRAYTGSSDSTRAEVHLDGTDVSVQGESAVGLMAGDVSGASTTAGDITFKNAEVVVDGTNAQAARVIAGSTLTIDNARLAANNSDGTATGVYVADAGSILHARDLYVHSSASDRAKGVLVETGGQAILEAGTIETDGGSFSHAIESNGEGSIVNATDLNVKTTGYAAVAYTGGAVTLDGGTFDVVGTTGIEDWDAAAGFVVGGYEHTPNSTLTATNVRLINSAPLNNEPAAAASWALRVGAGFVGGQQDLQADMSLTDSEVIASGPRRQIAAIQNNSHLSATNTLLVSEEDAGIALYDNASLTLDGSTLETGEESLRSSFSNSGSEQTIIITGNSVIEQNNGTLLRVTRNAGGEDGIVNMTLENGVYVSGDIRNYDSAGNLVDSELTRLDIHEDALWAGIVIDDMTRVVEGGGGPQTDFTTDGNVSITGDDAHQFDGETHIGGSISVGAGQHVAFDGGITVGDDLVGQNGASTTLNGSSHIGGTVTGSEGAVFSFNGDTSIEGSVRGAASSFQFSPSAPTTIAGDVDLYSGSVILGGSIDTPVEIGGDIHIEGGSVLAGNLNVAGSLSAQGGVLSPGNSIGLHTYGSAGGITGTYVAEINAAGQSDLITVTSGSVDLTDIDLLVRQENGNGGYRLNHDYTIVQTGDADGISAVADNRFASQSLDDTFEGTLVRLDDAVYGADSVTISLSPDHDVISEQRSGMSKNQRAALDGVLSVRGNAAADAALQSTDYKDALNQLSGELHGSTQAALLQNSSLVSRTLMQRMRGNMNAGLLAGAPVAQTAGALPASAMPSSAAYPLWAQVVGNWSTLDSDGNAARVKTNTAGLFIGGDIGLANGWRLGAALGYTDGRVKVDGRDSRSDVESYTAALYGSNSWEQETGTLNFLMGAAYTHHDIDSRRRVNVGGNQTLKADYRAHTTQLFTELGYSIPVGGRSVAEPYLGLAWIDQKSKGFTEQGGAAALKGDRQNDDMITFTLGLRGQTEFEVGANLATIHAGLGWRHASGDVDPHRRLSFAEGGGSSFSVSGAPIARNAAVFDLGVEMPVGRNTAMGLGYSGQYGDDNTDHSAMMFLRARF